MTTPKEPVYLLSLQDAIQARGVCEVLEGEGILFTIEDSSSPQSGLRRNFDDGPAILLEIFVNAEDVSQATTCLRRTMGLFPERESVESSGYEKTDDEVLLSAFACDQLPDAEAVKQFLLDSGISSTIRREIGEEGDSIEYAVEVKGQDIERAISVVNQWLESR